MDLGFSVKSQSVEIFEIRPRWQHPEEIMHSPVVKTTYVKTQDVWKIYWMRQDLKWHGYEPLPEVRTIEEFLVEVDADPYLCFWGWNFWNRYLVVVICSMLKTKAAIN